MNSTENITHSQAKEYYNNFYSNNDFVKFPKSEKAFICSLVKKFNIPKGSKVIDIGCGTGKYSHLLSEEGMEVTGVDLSEQAVVQAKKNYKQPQFLVGNALNLPFPQESFDVVYCSGLSLYNTSNLLELKTMVNHHFSLLKKNGFFVFLKTSGLTDSKNARGSRIDYKRQTFEDFFRSCNFRIIAASSTYPQVFRFLGKYGFSSILTALSEMNTGITKIPLRVCIVCKK